MSKVNFKPLYDKVLVRKASKEEKTSGGLFVPDSAKEKPNTGEVIAVGDGCVYVATGLRQKMAVEVGYKVMFGKYAGTDIKLNNEDYLIISETDILGIISTE